MDRIDVLGDRPDRHSVFTRHLLTETEDEELQRIVREAATELSSPIALVSLVLDQIQFFKASVGLPPALAKARGTHRDASFCQFIVERGRPFEVNDAPNDPRIPQHVVKNYNIRAYLGVPVYLEDMVIGSLCVLDTRKRTFTEAERESLHTLSQRVNERLEALTRSRRQRRLDLSESAIRPGLSELEEALRPIRDRVKAGYSAVAAIRSFFQLTRHLLSKQELLSDAHRLSFEAALEANRTSEELLYDIEAASDDALDCVHALDRLTSNSGSLRLSEVVIAGQDLARNATKMVGGCYLPEFTRDPIVYTNGNLAIAIVTNCILALAASLGEKGSKAGVNITVNDRREATELAFSTGEDGPPVDSRVVDHLTRVLGNDPSIFLDLVEGEILVIFKTIEPG